ncbi:MAG: hypothetical protein H6595_06805 [Flavobacteriales bacterium]|nr:hypothetical protein [Flavobacteriales bacterium]MCB9167175.1 hypothetical protein [Flavobacteriales bacterium]
MKPSVIRLLLSNAIHIGGFLVAIYLFLVIGSIFYPTEGWRPVVLTGFPAALYLLWMYGAWHLLWLLGAMCAIDLCTVLVFGRMTQTVLILQGFILCGVLLYWALELEDFLVGCLSVSAGLTQWIRARWIDRSGS